MFKVINIIENTINHFEKIEEDINTQGYFCWGDLDLQINCPGNPDITVFRKTGVLPAPCDNCYKVCVFWDGTYSEENLRDFFKIVVSFKYIPDGKLNRKVALFYFEDLLSLTDFFLYLYHGMRNNRGFLGHIHYRRACEEYERSCPLQWKNNNYGKKIKIV